MVRILLWTIGLSVVALALSVSFKKPQLNVIVISVDSLRADHMSLYGYARNTTPNTDAWAHGAYVFSKYFASSYLTPISEGSVQTGVYPFRSGIINFESVAHPLTQFFAEILKQQGYQTAAFGSSPEFEANVALKESFSRGFDVYKPFIVQHTATTTPLIMQKKVSGRNSDTAVHEALAWVAKNRSHPFYLWLPLGGIHMPYLDSKTKVFADPTYAGVFSTITNDEFKSLYGRVYQNVLYANGSNQHTNETLSPDDIQYIRDRYDDGILETDMLLKQVYDYLRETGLDQNTIVVFESEHGEALGERGYIAHYDVYDEGIHTPLIIKIPHQFGRPVSALASSVDILPTLLSELSLPTLSVDGVSFEPYLRAATTSVPRTSVLSIRTPLWVRIAEDVAFITKDNSEHFYDSAARSSEWKLIHRVARDAEYRYGWWGTLTGVPIMRPEYELYDMVNDPNEERNVYLAHQTDSATQVLKQELAEYEAGIAAQKQGTTTLPVQPYF